AIFQRAAGTKLGREAIDFEPAVPGRRCSRPKQAGRAWSCGGGGFQERTPFSNAPPTLAEPENAQRHGKAVRQVATAKGTERNPVPLPFPSFALGSLGTK